MTTTWPQTVERVRQRGGRTANALLDAYYRRRFATAGSCWVARARQRIEKEMLKCTKE